MLEIQTRTARWVGADESTELLGKSQRDTFRFQTILFFHKSKKTKKNILSRASKIWQDWPQERMSNLAFLRLSKSHSFMTDRFAL